MEKILKCPVCGEEYLPGELVFPNYIIGQPKNIIKSDMGKIEYWEDNDLSELETYICDKCNTPLDIEVKVEYKIRENSKYNFNKDSSTKIFTNDRISLKEI